MYAHTADITRIYTSIKSLILRVIEVQAIIVVVSIKFLTI